MPAANVLYVVHRLPYPPDKGDRIRAFHILRYLNQRYEVDLACLADEPVTAEATQVLQGLCRKLAVIPVGPLRWFRALASLLRGRSISEGAFSSASLRALLQAWSRETKYQAALASSSSMVPYLQLPELQTTPAVVDLVDVDSQKWLDYAESRFWPRSWLYRTEAKRVRTLERSLASWARAVTLVSEPEAELYQRIAGTGPVHAVTNGVDLDYFKHEQPGSPTNHTCVFVGALDYYPNVDAVCWFSRHVWPKVHARHPTSRFLVVGRRPASAVLSLACIPGVEVRADVPDVRPSLREAAVVVAPLRIARGLQNKVLEALAMGRAVVASPAALVALQVKPGIHLLEASSIDAWGDAILRLFEHDGLRRQLGFAGRRFVEDRHDWTRCLEPLAELLAPQTDSPQPRPVLSATSEVPE